MAAKSREAKGSRAYSQKGRPFDRRPRPRENCSYGQEEEVVLIQNSCACKNLLLVCMCETFYYDFPCQRSIFSGVSLCTLTYFLFLTYFLSCA